MAIIIYIVTAISSAFIIRVFYLFYKILRNDCQLISGNNSLRTIYCIGSGGHTTELLRIMSHLDSKKFQPRLFILAKNDTSSEIKIQNLENESTNYSLYRIPRSRNVKQSYISSVFTTVYATLCTIPILYSFKPDVIFCNGPGTCIPVCLVAFLLRCLFILDCRIIFIESLCRVRTLSLSGNKHYKSKSLIHTIIYFLLYTFNIWKIYKKIKSISHKANLDSNKKEKSQ